MLHTDDFPPTESENLNAFNHRRTNRISSLTPDSLGLISCKRMREPEALDDSITTNEDMPLMRTDKRSKTAPNHLVGSKSDISESPSFAPHQSRMKPRESGPNPIELCRRTSKSARDIIPEGPTSSRNNSICDRLIPAVQSFISTELRCGLLSRRITPSVSALKPSMTLVRSPKDDVCEQTVPLRAFRKSGSKKILTTAVGSDIFDPGNMHTPSSAPSPDSSYTGSPLDRSHRPVGSKADNSILRPPYPGELCSPHKAFGKDPAQSPSNVNTASTRQKSMENSTYIPSMELLVDAFDLAPIDNISRFGKSPISSPIELNGNSNRSMTLPDIPSFSQHPDQVNSNATQRPPSIARTSPLSDHSSELHRNKTSKATCAQIRQQRKGLEQGNRQPLPPLHLHLSKDGSSPLPPGWQRAPNTKHKLDSSEADQHEADEQNMYAYYYYHVRTRQTRWDPPVYPWDADPMDALTDTMGTDDPEAPYNWGCASKYAVTHDEIEAMYGRIRQRILERQCTELLHELAGKPDVPRGAAEQGFAIELFTLVHNVLRTFRDARCQTGRILNDEDLYYLTKKLAQAVILKEIQKLRQAQAATSSSLFAAIPTPELNAAVHARVSSYVKKYMECKGSFYRRRLQQPPLPPVPSHHPRPHAKPDGRHHHQHQTRAFSGTRPHLPSNHPNVHEKPSEHRPQPGPRIHPAAERLS